jgi:hypothetical protein
MPGSPPKASESANRVAKFWFCGLGGDTVTEWMSLSLATHSRKASTLTCLSGG